MPPFIAPGSAPTSINIIRTIQADPFLAMTITRDLQEQEAQFSPTDIARLLGLIGGIARRAGCSVTDVIERLEHAPESTTEPRPPSAQDIDLGEFVERLRKVRAKRNQMLGTKMFRDPAWDMLLDLFAANERGEQVSVSSLCYSSGVPSSTALRAVQRLEQQGMIAREGDPNDLRRSWVRATPKVLAEMTTIAELFTEAVIASAQ